MKSVRFAMALLILSAPFAAARGSDSSGEELYRLALQQMRRAPVSPYVTYSISIDGRKINLALTQTPTGSPRITLARDKHGSSHLDLTAAYRSLDGHTSVKMQDGRFGVGTSPFLSATWLGAYDWMRFGDEGPPDDVASSPMPRATSSDEPSSSLKIIAVVAGLGTGYYRVEDVGSMRCPNGGPGHAVHLVARRDPDRHPLTDAIIDLQSGRFCMMRFREPFKMLHPPFLGMLEFHFKTENGYTVISDEHMDFVLKRLGVTVDSFALDVRYSDFRFSQDLDPATFPQPTVP